MKIPLTTALICSLDVIALAMRCRDFVLVHFAFKCCAKMNSATNTLFQVLHLISFLRGRAEDTDLIITHLSCQCMREG